MLEKKEKYFSQEMKQAAIEWLNERWKNRVCDCCGKQDSGWTMADDLLMPMTFSGGNLNIGGAAYPQIALICNYCAHMKYFNAVIMNVVRSVNGEKNG